MLFRRYSEKRLQLEKRQELGIAWSIDDSVADYDTKLLKKDPKTFRSASVTQKKGDYVYMEQLVASRLINENSINNNFNKIISNRFGWRRMQVGICCRCKDGSDDALYIPKYFLRDCYYSLSILEQIYGCIQPKTEDYVRIAG
jgi:hypothetical protein